MKEVTKWFLEQNQFILIPSETSTLAGDLGLRDFINIDVDNQIIFTETEKFFYSKKVSDKIKFFIFLINGKKSNPIYSSNPINLNSLQFINFAQDLLTYNVGDKINIYNASNLSLIAENLTITNINLLENSIVFSNNFIDSNVLRYKVVNTTGTPYFLIDLEIFTNKILLNHRKKFSTKIYANI